ncbi:hypothetical protein RVR_9996 [Actinacidiphila reveromycinica]|uniref:Uncharacterized protein n=1 Tax=Actinacidiphila reveromycinica TaxID=659352 RepID=A0A7U3VSX1_9ACTN|nr:hypothetical protein [Streptomyces sp. SN-593]BBB02224.1 hypothetical protein RVR_9996 [Streptomyces sp. SN-593]
MGFKFTLILNREITEQETADLRDAGCAQAEFSTDTLPTDASVTVARLDFDDTESTSLAEAIEAGLEAVKKVPELSVPGLNVPAQPAHLESDEEQAAQSGQAADTDQAATADQARDADLVEAAASE